MSAVLGPIHQWMYKKVLTREELIGQIINTAEDNNWETAINGKPLKSFTRETFPPIEEVIDLSNIHYSLSSLIQGVENRYAELIVGLLHRDGSRFDLIKDMVHSFGLDNRICEGSTLQEAFQAINDILLDGMPCDRAMNITGSSEKCIAFSYVSDTHTEYWKKYGGDGDDFYTLRLAFIEGMLENSGHRLQVVGDRMYELH
ncbi:hypothetical protein [Oribacterium sp. WCC10]|uniref:hypothetical protein n=1 Tax=Oribacterium sp. WCC10 TaxID=1855343 RepID=UPI0008E6D887|nr:hypothetical protein [Oribacterium sp. WCC10]SFG16201.1 hypothetical protein SAMN05216356_102237 [Oribacterium sp. WCC10]